MQQNRLCLILAIAFMFATSILAATQIKAQSKPLILSEQNTIALQKEPQDPKTGRYDWGPSVMKDNGLYKMWWTRLGGTNNKRFPYKTTLDEGQDYEFTYPDWGDRIYYAESTDGKKWNISGQDFQGKSEDFGPDSSGVLMVLEPAENKHQINHIGCPSVIKFEGIYYMYYEAPSEYIVKKDKDGKITVGTEYHNQIFVATSKDGKIWQKYPLDNDPQPTIPAPPQNKQPDHRRYGLGQPSVFYKGRKFVMHYVDSCTLPGDFVVRIEANNPYFKDPRKFWKKLLPKSNLNLAPDGCVARFAQTDIKLLNKALYLLRPAYDTGNLNLLASTSGLFDVDTDARSPQETFPQIRTIDPRGANYKTRLFPDFLTDPTGQIIIEDNHAVLFYSSGLGFQTHAYTWDLYRSELIASDLEKINNYLHE